MSDEKTKKDEGNVGTTRQETSASALPDSNLEGVVGGAPHSEISITKQTDASSAKQYVP